MHVDFWHFDDINLVGVRVKDGQIMFPVGVQFILALSTYKLELWMRRRLKQDL